MKQELKKSHRFKTYAAQPVYVKKYIGAKEIISLLAVCVLATILIVRFLDNVHYNNEINQDVQRIEKQQSNIGTDITKLFQDMPSTLDCSQFSSPYVIQQCELHDKALGQ
jgi:type VI protein secretion system component VasK